FSSGSTPVAEAVPTPLGTIVLITVSNAPQLSFDKAKGQKDLARDRAGSAAGKVLAVHTGDGLLDLAIAAGTTTLAPFAAARAALSARQPLTPNELARAESALVSTMETLA